MAELQIVKFKISFNLNFKKILELQHMAELQISVVSDPASKRQIQVTTKSLTILVNYQKTNLIGELINSYNELVSSFIIVKLTRVSAIVVGFKAADF